MYHRVLCVTAEKRVCELTRYLVRLVKGLRGLGHEVLCFLPEGAGAVSDAVGGRQWWGFGSVVGGMLFRREWLNAAVEFQPTVVHACGLQAARSARLLAGALAVPLVHSLFETPSWLGLRQVAEAGDRAGGRFPCCLVASHAKLAEELRARLSGTGVRVEVILPGVFTPPGRAGGEAEGEPPVIGMVAELDGSADVDLLLRAVRVLKGEGVNVECALVGEGPQERRLRRLARGLGLRTETDFLTALLDPEPVLAEMALVVVLPRRRLPVLSILEAQASGRAVVSVQVPGIDQFVEDGVTGRLLPRPPAGHPTPQALATVIKELLADRGARRRLGEEASSRVSQSASVAKMLEATVLLYDGLGARLRGAS
jgi:glycosyltransferase involved in cell wall biosynthesis